MAEWTVLEDANHGKRYPSITDGEIYLCSCGTPINRRWDDALSVAQYLNAGFTGLSGWKLSMAGGEPKLVSDSGGCVGRDTWLNAFDKRSFVRREMTRLFSAIPLEEAPA